MRSILDALRQELDLLPRLGADNPSVTASESGSVHVATVIHADHGPAREYSRPNTSTS